MRIKILTPITCSFSSVTLALHVCTLCPFCFCLSLFVQYQYIHLLLCPSPTLYASSYPSVSPSLRLVFQSRLAGPVSCCEFSTTDSSTELPLAQQCDSSSFKNCGLSVGWIMLPSACPLCNHCESIVVQKISGFSGFIKKRKKMFDCLTQSQRNASLFLISERPGMKNTNKLELK